MHWSTDELLLTREVADILGVSHSAVTRWVQAGRMLAIRTPAGHYRFPAEYIDHLLAGGSWACDGLDRSDLTEHAHTITAEPLTRAMCARMQFIKELIGERGVVERRHGRFVTVRLAPGEELRTVEDAAEAVAWSCGAEYVEAK